MIQPLERLSIRARIVLLALAIMLPLAAILAWSLANELRQTRSAAEAKVAILADQATAELERLLHRSQVTLAHLAERPLVRAMNPARCDPMLDETTRLDPDLGSLWVRDLQGRVVCSSVPNPILQLDPREAPWFDDALRRGGFSASNAVIQQRTGRWVTVLTHPIRDDHGTVIGLLTHPIDLLSLGEQLLASTPKTAVVTVADRTRAILLRSAEPQTYVGTRPKPGEADPARGRREGLMSTPGRDGVQRLFAFRTLAGLDWRVSASLPEAEVFADYETAVRRTFVSGLGVVLLALALAWRLSAAIVRPVAQLARVAAGVASGNAAARASVDGPPEVSSVAQQFNRMLDARDASEAERRESEARYRSLVNWLPEAISVHRDGKVLFVNKACVKLLRAKSSDDLVGHDSLEFIQPDSRLATRETVSGMVERSLEVARLEQVFIRLDGTLVDVELHAMPIVYGGQRVVLASMRDITERKQTELALATSQAQLRGIFDSAPVAILTTDESQTIVKANPAAAAVFRCEIDALIGAPLSRLIPPQQREAHRGAMQAFGETENSARHMGRPRGVMGLRADGEEFPMDAAISHLSVNGERLFTVILRDTTERHRAETALHESEANLRRLLVMLPEAVFVNSGNRMSFVNEAAQRLFGTDESALLGRSPFELIHHESHDLVRARIAALRGGTTIMPLAQVKIVRADGAIRVVESTATLVEDPDEDAIVVVMRDVTELAEARQALADSHAELQRLVASQDRVQEEERRRIARELHDDLQQTLAAIRIDLVAINQRLESAPDSLAPLLAETGDLAAAAIDSTRRIINDLRPQMLEDLGLMPALEALVAQFSRRTGIDCRLRTQGEFDQDAAISPTVATCFYRVTQEALGNAAQHAQASRVRVRLARMPGDRIVLRISDNGKGMVTGPRKPESFGLLGMQERMRALGGVLRVDSTPGSGTTIEVDVPASVSASAHGAASAIHPIGADSLTPSAAIHPVRDLVDSLDALDGGAAVLDRHGVILSVNRAWSAIGRRDGGLTLRAGGPGDRYVELCHRAVLAGGAPRRAQEGLTAVLDERQDSFTFEYADDSSDAKRSFRMHVAALGRQRVLVTHVLLTPGVDPAHSDEPRGEVDPAMPDARLA
jgi:PAS domain S-box-containing protein